MKCFIDHLFNGYGLDVCHSADSFDKIAMTVNE